MGTRLRVLYDAFELSPDGGKSMGIYHYAVNVWRALQEVLPADVELVLAGHGANIGDFPIVKEPGSAGCRATVRQLGASTPGRLRRQWWMRFGAQQLARREGCDVYFSPKGFLPGWWGAALGLRTCVVVHDLIPLWYADHHPGQFGAVEAMLVNGGLTRACRHSNRLVTISHAAARDMQRRLPGMRPPTVVHNGLPPAPSQVKAPALTRPYIFAIASALPHKNASGLLEGYRHYRAQTATPLDLVVCGIGDPRQEGVQAVKGLSAAELHGYYQGAELFVFLSLAEGFGFPPLEAMMHGTPSLCSDIDVLRETTMGNAFFVDPEIPQAIGLAISHALSPATQDARNRIRERARQVTANYSWQACGRALAEAVLSLQP